jgi:hypothetical protein
MATTLPILRAPAPALAVRLRPERETLQLLLQGLRGLVQEIERSATAPGNALAVSRPSSMVSAEPRTIERPRRAVD